METIDKQFSNSELTISSQTKDYFQEAGKWAYFLSIIGFIGLGLMILGGVLVFFLQSAASGSGGFSFFGIAIVAILYFFPIYYLFLFGQKIKAACKASSQSDFDHGIENLKSFFKFLGIFTIVIISIYILIFLLGILAATSV
jgi:hypothetical protein